jgi:hypothetical protein
VVQVPRFDVKKRGLTHLVQFVVAFEHSAQEGSHCRQKDPYSMYLMGHEETHEVFNKKG